MSQLTMAPMINGLMPDQKSYARIPDVHSIPTLIKVQIESFEWFKTEGLRELFDEISPIESFNKEYSLFFPGDNDIAKRLNLTYWFGDPKYSEAECREMDMTFAAPLHLKVALVNNLTGEATTQEVYMGDFPLMTEHGTFVINGAERVVVSQLIRSPGVYFSATEDRATGRVLCSAKLIPNRGAWLEFETSKRDILSVKVDRKRKVPVTMLLKAVGVGDGTDDGLINIFAGADNNSEHEYIRTTLDKESPKMTKIDEALMEFYKKLRPGDPPTLDNAKSFLTTLLFTQRRYDLGRVGRHKLNRRLYGTDIPADQMTQERIMRADDLVKVIEHMILINNGVEGGDDIDHLGNRRVKTVGELIQNHLRIGLLRLERVVRERMSVRDPEQMTAINLVNIRPVVAAMREFFGGSQLSQFMDQTNPLAELTHKRTLSALGPGGLRRERAGFDVRDVHHSHYGRICPIETPEGPNIGLIGRLATYGQINEFGFIETPYRIVKNEVVNKKDAMLGRTLRDDVTEDDSDKVIAQSGTVIDDRVAAKLAALPKGTDIPVRAFATDEIVYLAADEEDRYTIAQANARVDELGQFVDRRVEIRRHQTFLTESSDRVQYLDVSPKQIVGVSAALIPFLEHDDANRALMGSNMQRQAVPLLRPEAPVVGTGMEAQAALDSGQVIVAEEDGEVTSVTARDIKIRGANKKEKTYVLRKYNRSNQSTCIDQRPIVSRGQKIKKGTVIADSSSTDKGQIALGQNVVVAFMSWEGGNYEDAILISQKMAWEDKFSSIHIEKHEIEARDTKLGPEEITRDIPNVGEDVLKDLDEEGIIRIGAEVGPGDILVGKITPKGETDLTPEEKLLRAIFGEKAREVKDSSLRLPHGERGKVVDVHVFTRDEHHELAAGVDKLVRVSIAQQRKITEGDKMAGRHGNKGVISQVVPIEDMPYLEDGTPVDIVLNPLGVPARMNIGQILETHLGWAADRLGFKVVSPVFDGADEAEISAELARAWMIDQAWYEITNRAWAWLKEQEYNLEDLNDDNEARVLYLQELLKDADRRKLANDHVYARRQVLRYWLTWKGYDPDEILSFENDTRTPTERLACDKSARVACYRLWLELHSGHKVSEKLEEEQLQAEIEKISQQLKVPPPTAGKMTLYDGKTGRKYDQPVTVGTIYMMKLAHLVEDKVHARSTGPYSLVTQQPLGGKAQFGGQRFGEMEVWALEAYGAAHTLQEMLTVKSDDVTGRVKTYEAIVKGEEIMEAGVPESFRVLVKELQSLGLSVEVFNPEGEKMQFGKEESEEKVPQLGMGLLHGEAVPPRTERDVQRERRERFARGERIGRRHGRGENKDGAQEPSQPVEE